MKKSEMNYENEKGGQASKNSILCVLLASLGGFKHTVTKLLVNNLTETAITSARTLPQCTMEKMQEYIIYMYMISQ